MGDFYGLQPLDDPTRAKTSRLGAPTSLYRCISETDGESRALPNPSFYPLPPLPHPSIYYTPLPRYHTPLSTPYRRYHTPLSTTLPPLLHPFTSLPLYPSAPYLLLHPRTHLPTYPRLRASSALTAPRYPFIYTPTPLLVHPLTSLTYPSYYPLLPPLTTLPPLPTGEFYALRRIDAPATPNP